MLIIGSKALNKYCPELRKVGKDVDIFGKQDDINKILKKLKSSKHFNLLSCLPYSSNIMLLRVERLKEHNKEYLIEFTIVDEGSSGEDILKIEKAENRVRLASKNMLLLLKKSHRYLKNSPHFWKTKKDISTLEMIGAYIPEEWADLLRKREKETYHYNLPKLNVSKDSFFKKEESFYKYDHDSIHEAMKIESVPAYSLFIDDDKEVFCSKDKFFALDQRVRFNAVIEESLVLALERSQIPNDFKVDPDKSFKHALSKVCTSITSGWFREFAWEYCDVILFIYNLNHRNYVDKFKKALESGSIKPFGR